MPLDRCPSTSRRAGAALHLVALAALALGSVTACRDTPADFNPATPDSGAPPTLCTRREDCGGTGICVSGVCETVQPCQMDEQCAASGKVCHQSRGYCVECDGRAGQCGMGETCQFDFTCVVLGARDGGTGDAAMCSGTCADRTQCGAGLVCASGACCPPPARCSSPEQCPASRPLCNGATGECFGGDSCTTDPDCANRTGCTGNRCFCDKPAGMNTGECRTRPDECQRDADCLMNGTYNGRFCTTMAVPKVCSPAPNCTSDVDCAGASLVCDLTPGSPSNGRCVNGTQCPNGTECTASQACVGGLCVAKNCVNTPNFCPQGQVCNPQTAVCGPGMSTMCQRDTDCPARNYCDTAQNRCAPGCRDASECGGGICNAAHQCEGGGSGMLCGSCTTDADCPAGTSCHTSPLTNQMRCQEACNMFTGQDCMIDTNATCLFLWCACGL